MTEALLSVSGLVVNYGHIEAVRGIDFALQARAHHHARRRERRGQVDDAARAVRADAQGGGRVVFDGHDVTALPAHKLVGAGLVQVAEGRATLSTLTVRENLELGAYTRRDGAAARASDLERMFALFPRLKEREAGLAGNLSGGEQQMLAIGRALMARRACCCSTSRRWAGADRGPGHLPHAARDQPRRPDDLPREQNVRQALKIAERAYVLENGRIVLEGGGRELLDEPKVQAAYLGG
jgi:branched-chain amino acid transport system ATP-binding protein